jgi:choline dehydrogenase-like flavoprotein
MPALADGSRHGSAAASQSEEDEPSEGCDQPEADQTVEQHRGEGLAGFQPGWTSAGRNWPRSPRAAPLDAPITDAKFHKIDRRDHASATSGSGTTGPRSSTTRACGLRVIDASIIPDTPSTVLNLTVMMLAEHIHQRVYQA